MEIIDINSWKRKEHFNFFKDMSYPIFNICFEIDITLLHQYIKEHQLPFYYSSIYYFMNCINRLDEFMYRFENNKIVRYNSIFPSFTVIDDKTELFKILTVVEKNNFKKFILECSKKSKEQNSIIDYEMEKRNDLVYITSIPWISFTNISHPISLHGFDTIPRISWGKYRKENDRIILPFSVQANHAFLDGIHVGKLKNEIENNIKSIKEIFS